MYRYKNALDSSNETLTNTILEIFHVVFPFFSLSHTSTIDINECEQGIGKCPGNKECVNIPGGYDCADSKEISSQYVQNLSSSATFRGDKTGHKKKTRILLICFIFFHFRTTKPSTFTPQARSLACSKGYKQQGDKCVGKFQVVCVTRFFVYFKEQFGFSKCISFFYQRTDIDECAIDKSACDSNQNCINTPGSFQCECKVGFTMDKVVNACVGK